MDRPQRQEDEQMQERRQEDEQMQEQEQPQHEQEREHEQTQQQMQPQLVPPLRPDPQRRQEAEDSPKSVEDYLEGFTHTVPRAVNPAVADPHEQQRRPDGGNGVPANPANPPPELNPADRPMEHDVEEEPVFADQPSDGLMR